MSFGSCCVLQGNNYLKMKPKAIEILGVQKGLILNFEVKQIFQHSQPQPQEISYIFPDDFKMCIYDLKFAVGDKIIKPELKAKNEALETYKEAISEGKTAIYGANIANGLNEFKLGNLPPKTACKVILKIAFCANQINENSFYVKFPLDVYTPYGSVECLDIKKNFSLMLHSESDKIKKITSNVVNGVFDENTKTFSISKKIVNKDNENSIIITFETVEQLENSVMIAPNDEDSSYDFCSLLISPNKEIFETQKDETMLQEREFIFVVDCSGSMRGPSIMNAAECLEIIIRSLPQNSFFNVILFGSSYTKLFENSQPYNNETSTKAISKAQNLKADLGGTNIYDPLQDIFSTKPKYGQRQVFILTDGEVENTSQVLNLVEQKANENRCFSIGLGRGCDAGLIEGIARASNGKCDFVQEGDLISEKLIPQLQSSFSQFIHQISIHIEGDTNNSFEVVPFPIPGITLNNIVPLFLRNKKENGKDNSFSKGFLLSGVIGKETVEFPIDNVESLQNIQEDEYGCSRGFNIGKAIMALFAYKQIQNITVQGDLSNEQISKIVDLSISSGILTAYTGYVGMVEPSQEAKTKSERVKMMRYVCFCVAPPREYFHPFVESSFPDDDNDDDDDDNYAELLTFDSQKNSSFNLMSIIRCQNSEGFWEDLNEIKTITGININHIDKIKVNDPSLETKCVATFVAIAAIHIRSADKKNTWKMIEQKAIDWLKKTLPQCNINEIMKEIEKFA